MRCAQYTATAKSAPTPWPSERLTLISRSPPRSPFFPLPLSPVLPAPPSKPPLATASTRYVCSTSGAPLRSAPHALRPSPLQVLNWKDQTLQCSLWHDAAAPLSAQPCVVFLHGLIGNRTECLYLLSALLSLHFSVVAFDFAGSGQSEGDFVSWGFSESRDLGNVIDHIKDQFGATMVFLWGMNTGAAAGVLHLGQALDPDAVSGIVIDSVFSSFDIALKEALSRSQKKGRIGIPTFVGKGAAAIVLRSVRKKLGYDSGEFTTSRLSPLEFAKRIDVPALFAASGSKVIKPHHSDKVHAKWKGKKRLVSIDSEKLHGARPVDYVRDAALFLHEIRMELQPDFDAGDGNALWGAGQDVQKLLKVYCPVKDCRPWWSSGPSKPTPAVDQTKGISRSYTGDEGEGKAEGEAQGGAGGGQRGGRRPQSKSMGFQSDGDIDGEGEATSKSTPFCSHDALHEDRRGAKSMMERSTRCEGSRSAGRSLANRNEAPFSDKGGGQGGGQGTLLADEVLRGIYDGDDSVISSSEVECDEDESGEGVEGGEGGEGGEGKGDDGLPEGDGMVIGRAFSAPQELAEGNGDGTVLGRAASAPTGCEGEHHRSMLVMKAARQDAMKMRKTSLIAKKGASRMINIQDAPPRAIGYLMKKGKMRWQKRFFVMSGHYLTYCEKEAHASDPSKRLGCIDLDGLTTVASDGSSPTALLIEGAGFKRTVLKAEDTLAYKTWVAALKGHLNDMRGSLLEGNNVAPSIPTAIAEEDGE